MEIRESSTSELDRIRELHLDAFDAEENEEVSRLAVELAVDSATNLSLVALDDGLIVGHVVFSPVSVSNHVELSGFILAPLAVAPSRQKQGVGSKLIDSGLDTLATRDVDVAFVLGDPNYYGRSGFHTEHDVNPPYQLPYPEAWQARELRTGALEGISGTVQCVPASMCPAIW